MFVLSKFTWEQTWPALYLLHPIAPYYESMWMLVNIMIPTIDMWVPQRTPFSPGAVRPAVFFFPLRLCFHMAADEELKVQHRRSGVTCFCRSSSSCSCRGGCSLVVVLVGVAAVCVGLQKYWHHTYVHMHMHWSYTSMCLHLHILVTFICFGLHIYVHTLAYVSNPPMFRYATYLVQHL